MKIVRLVLVAGAFGGPGGCGSGYDSGYAQDPVTEKTAAGEVVRGEVIDIDSGAMERDGEGILRIFSDDGRDLTILIPSWESRPEAAGLDLFPLLKKGDLVEASGEYVRDDEVRLHERSHYLEVVTE